MIKSQKMKKTSILLSLSAHLLCSCNSVTGKTDAEKFTGRWRLHRVETRSDSMASWEPATGRYKNRKGFIIYDGQGGMGVHHVRADYELYRFEGKGGPDSFTTNDLRQLADNFVYFGKYRVIDSSGIVEHHIESAGNPQMWGKVEKREYRFAGDTLLLSPVTVKYPKTRLTWIHMQD